MDPNKPPTDAPKFEFAVSTPAHGVCDVPGVRRLLCPPQARKILSPKVPNLPETNDFCGATPIFWQSHQDGY